jgi:hypothetical protein
MKIWRLQIDYILGATESISTDHRKIHLNSKCLKNVCSYLGWNMKIIQLIRYCLIASLLTACAYPIAPKVYMADGGSLFERCEINLRRCTRYETRTDYSTCRLTTRTGRNGRQEQYCEPIAKDIQVCVKDESYRNPDCDDSGRHLVSNDATSYCLRHKSDPSGEIPDPIIIYGNRENTCAGFLAKIRSGSTNSLSAYDNPKK